MTIELSESERATLIDLLVGIIEHDPRPLFGGCGVFWESSDRPRSYRRRSRTR